MMKETYKYKERVCLNEWAQKIYESQSESKSDAHAQKFIQFSHSRNPNTILNIFNKKKKKEEGSVYQFNYFIISLGKYRTRHFSFYPAFQLHNRTQTLCDPTIPIPNKFHDYYFHKFQKCIQSYSIHSTVPNCITKFTLRWVEAPLTAIQLPIPHKTLWNPA